MPSNVIDNPEDEKKWNKAKKLAKDQYDVEPESDEFHKRVMGIYKNMNPEGIDKESDMLEKIGKNLQKIAEPEDFSSGPSDDLHKLAEESQGQEDGLEKLGTFLKEAVEAESNKKK